jgi:PAS domain S-box-containing protein
MTLTDFHTGEIIEVNAEFTRLTGYTREEAIGRDVGSLNLWTDRVKASEFVKLLRSTKEARNIQDFVHTKLGDLVPCLMSGAVVDYAGRRCCLAVSRDITVLKRTQDQLVAAREAALAASQAKSEFLSSMSHEIRTPLNAILGMAELLDESRLDPDQRKYLDTMRHNGDALLRLINDILDLAKVESGRLTLESTEFDMEDLVGGVVEMLAVRAHSKGLELLSRVKPEVMPRVCGDPLRLRQILINLLGNSIKFTNSGQVLVTVERDEGSTDSALHFSVSDTGIGIAEDKLATIFSNFTQADSSTTRRYGGSGLGLAIAKRLVELMGGRIWVESEKDRGSVFHFTAQFEKTQTDETEKKAIALPPQLRDSRVLIVDDNETNRLILKEMMTTAGARPVEAESGARALSLVEEAWRLGSRYGLVLLDRRMPQMDGLEVARRLRKVYHDITIIMLTSDDLRLNKSTLDEYALDGYLTKPVRRQELFEAVALAQARRSGRGLTISTARPRSVDNAGQQLDAAGLRILLADDSADNRLLVHAYCKNFPISFDDAEDGRIAVDKWKREKYDLIIMDVQMPEMDGLTAIRIIRNCEKKTGNLRTPVIALSAGALEEDVRRSLAAGADLHVSKPVKKKTLMDAILKLTESTNLVQSNAG